jgi:hypothetical protein
MKQKMKVSEFRDEFFESERDCAAAMGRTYMLSMNKKTVVTFEFD